MEQQFAYIVHVCVYVLENQQNYCAVNDIIFLLHWWFLYIKGLCFANYFVHLKMKEY